MLLVLYSSTQENREATALRNCGGSTMLSLVAVGDIFLAAMSINVRKRVALTLKLGERTSISVIFLARPLAATMELD